MDCINPNLLTLIHVQLIKRHRIYKVIDRSNFYPSGFPTTFRDKPKHLQHQTSKHKKNNK